MIAALFVDPKGPYPQLLGESQCWDETRDARKYLGESPVIAHPPCGRWCGLAKLNERRWGTKVGEDGGCFESALHSVRLWGGVLEHPAFSIAWEHFGLQRPRHGVWSTYDSYQWVCQLEQSAYGHKARKKTWLLYCGDSPIEMRWEKVKPTHQIGGGINTGNRNLPRLSGTETRLTPLEFAKDLIRLVGGA